MLEPLEQSRWTPEAAAHLLNRAGFGGSLEEISKLHELGHMAAVDHLVSAGEELDLYPIPPLSTPAENARVRRELKKLAPQEQMQRKKMLKEAEREQIDGLRFWWLQRMRSTPNPVREKAVLFWHGHWATSVVKVKEPYLIWQQNETLRAHALGNFTPFAKEMTRDAAMIRYLDLNTSTARSPNENFARELMELFTLGEGNYTEMDIREAARAFAGYRTNSATGKFQLATRFADTGNKKFFGRSGPLKGDDVVEELTAQPRCAEFLAGKIWNFYAGGTPSPALLGELAGCYRKEQLHTGALLKKIFVSREFYSDQVVRRQIKSPVQWLVQTCKILDIPLPNGRLSDNVLRQLGQVLFAPPNVKGWDGGRAWISSATLLLRYNTAGQIVKARRSGENSPVTPPDIDRIIPREATPEEACLAIESTIFQSRMPDSLRQKAKDFLVANGSGATARRELLHLVMSTPEYQLT